MLIKAQQWKREGAVGHSNSNCPNYATAATTTATVNNKMGRCHMSTVAKIGLKCERISTKVNIWRGIYTRWQTGATAEQHLSFK